MHLPLFNKLILDYRKDYKWRNEVMTALKVISECTTDVALVEF